MGVWLGRAAVWESRPSPDLLSDRSQNSEGLPRWTPRPAGQQHARAGGASPGSFHHPEPAGAGGRARTPTRRASRRAWGQGQRGQGRPVALGVAASLAASPSPQALPDGARRPGSQSLTRAQCRHRRQGPAEPRPSLRGPKGRTRGGAGPLSVTPPRRAHLQPACVGGVACVRHALRRASTARWRHRAATHWGRDGARAANWPSWS